MGASMKVSLHKVCEKPRDLQLIQIRWPLHECKKWNGPLTDPSDRFSGCDSARVDISPGITQVACTPMRQQATAFAGAFDDAN
jgi:hypothetical protein